ncbi:hypothetical protein MMC07_009019 [Pseudocyphellaria aurata]|nr:hypothetical protein [Pseudocyphellaria aurata]
MHFSMKLLLLIITLWSSIAWTAPLTPQGRSFKVLQKRHDSAASRTAGSGVAAMEKAYRKFGIPLPKTLNAPLPKELESSAGSTVETPKSLAATGGGSSSSNVIATAEEGDSEFLSPVTIGGQTVTMDFDTGSSDLWVFNPQLPDFANSGHSLFDPTKSATFKPLDGATFKISYGDRSEALGTVGTDTVNIGGAEVAEQAIELATAVTKGFIQDANSDGLLGLGFSSINTVKPNKQRTFFDNIQSSLAEPVFTANLRHETVGSYEFGKIDTSKFQGSLSFTPVDSSRGFWEFESKSFAIGDMQTQTNAAASPAIADTGTSLMLVDEAVAEAYWSQVDGANRDKTLQAIVFPCDAKLPDFHVALGSSYMATIPGPLMNFSRAQGLPGSCFGGLQSNQGQPIQIYGDVMFKSQFVVFDGGKTTIGFAPHAI